MIHRKTCKRYNDPGDAHALTFSCFRRQAFLSKDGSRQWLIDAIERARSKHRFHVWAYVVMPEHAHLLVWPTELKYDISDLLNSIKQSVAKRALLHVRREAPGFLVRMEDRQPNGKKHYRFWQRGGGYDRNVVEPAAAFLQIEYFHNNPVRRGLCTKGGGLALVERGRLCWRACRSVENRSGVAACNRHFLTMHDHPMPTPGAGCHAHGFAWAWEVT
jgi:putative transposase